VIILFAELYEDENQNTNYEFDNILTYSKVFNSVHNLTVMAGYTFQETNGSNLGASRNNFLNNDPNMQVINAGSNNINNSGSKYSWAIQSYLGRINYGFKDKYLLSTSLRLTKLHALPKTTEPVFSRSFRRMGYFKREVFENVNFVNNLKLRASWGILGKPGYWRISLSNHA
jgi:hypothetical protein